MSKGPPWWEKDLDSLAPGLAKGETVREMAVRLNRTPRAIAIKMREMGLLRRPAWSIENRRRRTERALALNGDMAFQERMQAEIEAGREHVQMGVSKKPGTDRPQWKRAVNHGVLRTNWDL